jgi:hypothetical protein
MLTYVCKLHKKLRISECPQKISVIVKHIIDPHDVWETQQTVHLTFFLLTTWLYLNKWHSRVINSLSSTTYCICSSLLITWRTRSVEQTAQFTCLVQLIPSTYPVIHIKLCLTVTRPLTWSPIIFLGLYKQKNGRSLKISGLSVGRTSPSLVHVMATFLYPLFFICSSGTSSTTAQWHLCLLAHVICLSVTLQHFWQHRNFAGILYCSRWPLTRSPKPHSLKWSASRAVIERAHCNGTSLH